MKQAAFFPFLAVLLFACASCSSDREPPPSAAAAPLVPAMDSAQKPRIIAVYQLGPSFEQIAQAWEKGQTVLVRVDKDSLCSCNCTTVTLTAVPGTKKGEDGHYALHFTLGQKRYTFSERQGEGRRAEVENLAANAAIQGRQTWTGDWSDVPFEPALQDGAKLIFALPGMLRYEGFCPGALKGGGQY